MWLVDFVNESRQYIIQNGFIVSCYDLSKVDRLINNEFFFFFNSHKALFNAVKIQLSRIFFSSVGERIYFSRKKSV